MGNVRVKMSGMRAMVPPDWNRATTTLVPALTWGTECALLPDDVIGASAVVLVVLDSLGWHMLEQRPDIAPILTSLSGGAATTVAPSTTAAALTSISTGLPPGEHGIVGYRFPVGGAVMNALRWTTIAGDHRGVVSPSGAQTAPAMAGGPWTIVSGRQFVQSGFTEAHLGEVPYRRLLNIRRASSPRSEPCSTPVSNGSTPTTTGSTTSRTSTA